MPEYTPPIRPDMTQLETSVTEVFRLSTYIGRQNPTEYVYFIHLRTYPYFDVKVFTGVAETEPEAQQKAFDKALEYVQAFVA